MTKDPHQTPKAVNIIRPSSNYLLHHTTSTSSSGSSTSGSLLAKRPVTTRKLRVNSTSNKTEKPILNLYHPPTRKPSYDDYQRMTRPPIEIYKPPQRLTKSFTAPSLSQEHTQPITRPMSRPSRSVLGPINTPVAISTTVQETVIDPIDDKPTLETPNESEDSDNDIESLNAESDVEAEGVDNEDDEDEPIINEARVNRKIADLELSINSLLTVNAMLEATVRKQASQLSQMKTKMISGESIDSILEEVPVMEETDVDEEEEDWDKDVLFQKLRKITEHMIEQGQKSINFEYKILGRVLSNYTPQEDDEEEEPTLSTISLTETPTHDTQIPATSIPMNPKSSKPTKKKNN